SISGGIDTAPRAATARVAVLDVSRPLGARRPHAGSLTGETTEALPELRGTEVHFPDAVGLPTRDRHGDIALGAPLVADRPGPAGSLQLHVGDRKHPIGVLDVTAGKLRWTDGEVEASVQRPAAP